MTTAEDQAQSSAFQRSMDADVLRSKALALTTRHMRRHPQLAWWYQHPDGDSAHGEVVQRWKDALAAQKLLPGSDAGKWLDFLLRGAEDFLENQDAELALAWRYVRHGPLWETFSPAARNYYTMLHAQAAERSRYGGPRVLVSNGLAITMMASVCGRRYASTSVPSDARRELEAAGVLTFTTGQKWAKGVRSHPTEHNLLPESLSNCLMPLSARKGIRHLEACSGDEDDRARWSAADRKLFLATIGLIHENRRKEAGQQPAAATDAFAMDFTAAKPVTPTEGNPFGATLEAGDGSTAREGAAAPGCPGPELLPAVHGPGSSQGLRAATGS